MDLKQLKKEIPYKWRIQNAPWTKKPAKTGKGSCVAYIDARDVMDLLDEVCGEGYWQTEYYQVKNTMCCKIGIMVANGNWIWKSDSGDETSVEAVKGEVSDAFKRAAVQWGIGRFLYRKDIQWITEDEFKANKWKLTEYIKKRMGTKFTPKLVTTEKKGCKHNEMQEIEKEAYALIMGGDSTDDYKKKLIGSFAFTPSQTENLKKVFSVTKEQAEELYHGKP